MRILFVASLHHPTALQKAIAATPPGQPPPIFPPSMGQYHWDEALRRRGHTTAVFYRNIPAWGPNTEHHSQGISLQKVLGALARRIPPSVNPDYRARNQRLIAQAQQFQPDVVWMVGDNRVITPETLRTVRQNTGCKIVYSTGVSPIVFSLPIERAAARLYDLVLTNDFYHGVQWLELGAARMECLPVSACNPAFHKPYDLTPEQRRAYTCDIAFVGTLIPDHLYSQRVRALEALKDFDLGIWSVHDVPASLKPHFRGYALGEDMLEVFSAAKLTINVHGDFMRYGGNMRLFEAAGVGILQLADDLPGTRQWFTEGETIVTFRDLDDLRAKAAYYLSHDAERQRITRAAQAHVYAHHNYDQRVLQLEALLKTL
jgi:spore maturation protein CgeB